MSEGPSALRTARAAGPFSSDLRRAILVSATVGTTLVVLNQGDLLLAASRGASLPAALAWKIPLSYLVPLLVSFASSRAARRDQAG
jgi:hypothetical protein